MVSMSNGGINVVLLHKPHFFHSLLTFTIWLTVYYIGQRTILSQFNSYEYLQLWEMYATQA
jgi:hypothetical protein